MRPRVGILRQRLSVVVVAGVPEAADTLTGTGWEEEGVEGPSRVSTFVHCTRVTPADGGRRGGGRESKPQLPL